MAADVVVLVDGERRAPGAPAVAPLDPGLLGQGVYESIRTYGGEPFALDRARSGGPLLRDTFVADVRRDHPQAFDDGDRE